ncbi:unnamed protein product [Closterium sp. NIES-53]
MLLSASPPTALPRVQVGQRQMVLHTYDGGIVGWRNADAVGQLQVQRNKNAYDAMGGGPAGAQYTWNVREVTQVARIRGMNLGGWLVLEQWMTPSMYDGVPDLVDGWELKFKSVANSKYLRAAVGGDHKVTLTPTHPLFTTQYTTLLTALLAALAAVAGRRWEGRGFLEAGGKRGQAHVRIQGDLLPLLASPVPVVHGRWGQYIDYDHFAFRNAASPRHLNASSLIISHPPFLPSPLPLFPFSPSRLPLPPPTPLSPWPCMQLRCTGDGGSIDYDHFVIRRVDGAGGKVQVTSVQGEWQTAAYARDSGSRLPDHWRGFIVEDDWRYLAEQGINTVRIPVGYWIMQGNEPDWPFIPGTDAVLDSAFSMAEKYSIRIYLSMHSAPGGQNHGSESSSRDGAPDWQRYEGNINKTLDCIEWLASRYSKSPALFGIGLLNEPNTDMVPLGTGGSPSGRLKQYMLDAYSIIRKYSPCAFVGISPLLGQPPATDMAGFMTNALDHNNVMIDVHYYNVFDLDINTNPSFQAHIDYVRNQRATELKALSEGDRTVLVGEWSLALPEFVGAKEGDYGVYSQTQLEVYNNASAGWFFWSFKVDKDSHGVPNWAMITAQNKGWLTY